MAKGIVKYLGFIAAAILIFFGIMFIMSTNLGITYFFIGLAIIGVAVMIIFLVWERKPVEIKQTLTVTGPVTAKVVHCPTCNAVVDPTKVEVILGKPYVTCSYCNNKFELTEEPTW